MSVVVAGRLPDRVAAAAALPRRFSRPTAVGPHLLADGSAPSASAARRATRRSPPTPKKLDKAFSAAGVPHRIVLPGRPGFAVPDQCLMTPQPTNAIGAQPTRLRRSAQLTPPSRRESH